jgi:hypothetical protein
MKTTISDPPSHAEEVTLSDSTDIAMGTCRAFLCDQDCDLKVTMKSGATLTLYGLLGGVQYSAQITRFWSTGTTASTKVTAFKE